ncbi:M15 family metallopeptidase [Bradyrhizobium sp. BRP22]|uniref:M15 family metallopeptidase n=1 Tax=Bradyrhizobium sp. BRP22 TaxID=2793821 RepID=UPI001CD29E81|nr:M15 family metallopeptidase [Bradyrhizobium sp. BRP22]MCA1458088.1 M15 family metallopeptidase [Bradyrhizobium sp. BRP22]
MSRWPHDDPASLAAFYGDPAKDEPGKQLVPVVPPFLMYYDGQPIRRIMFHRKAADALAAALNEIWEHYGQDQATIDRLRISTYSGAYNRRLIRGSKDKWSNHAYGAAIDFDAEHNGFGTGHGTMPQPVIDAFKRQGALWGGDYKGRTDPMHFEFCSRGGVVAPPPPPKPAPKPQPEPEPIDPPPARGEHEQPPDDPTTSVPEPVPPAPTRRGFFGRLRNWIAGLATSAGFGGVTWLTDYKVAVVFFVFIFLMSASIVAFIIWLFGADRVREWARRHVA